MKVLSIVSQKGGTGKSTLATSLAVAAMQAGEKVFALDIDPQATLGRWFDRRPHEEPGFDRISRADALGPALQTLAQQGYSLVIIDTPGADTPGATAAIRVADLCLVPTQPAPFDLEATTPTLEAIMSTRRKFLFVLNRTPPKSGRVTEAAASLRVLGVLADPPITQRTDHQDAAGRGLGVTEFNPEGKAAAEMRELWAFVAKRLKG
jgi:chromosome partitioning protein